ncbi:ATP-binding protein [Patescibacteria group bacterium]|nr:ATP-binding protein [Patescibacteria group bacterium]
MTLLERILRQNPWWEDKGIEQIRDYKERILLKKVWKYRDNPQIIAILGLRRTGKTVLLLQIIQKLLRNVPCKKILYFSFDEILGKDPEVIEKVLEIYENEILKQDLKNVFVFLDEVNHLKDWQIFLKRYYDFPGKIKFFISGSSSIYLKKTKESLAGRIYEFNLLPLSFKEYLYLKNLDYKDLTKRQLVLKKELNKYLLSGTLPEIINELDFLKVKKYINSLVDKIVFYDIPKVYNVDEPEILKSMLSLIAQKPGMILEYQKFAQTFKVSYQTVSKYINYLEKSYLIKLVYNFRGSVIARARKLKKAYTSSPNLTSAFVDSEKEFLNTISLLAENTVCNHLNAQWFWRKYNELDFYDQNRAIEVKYSDTKPDIKNNLLAVKNLKGKRLLIVTHNFEDQETVQRVKVKYIPLWKWLLK